MVAEKLLSFAGSDELWVRARRHVVNRGNEVARNSRWKRGPLTLSYTSVTYFGARSHI